jgi:hypothetical protein
MSDFRAQIETNLFGTIIVTKAALPYFRQREAGHFVQFLSMGGRIGPPGRGPYSAAKWGVEGFSEVLSREVAPLLSHQPFKCFVRKETSNKGIDDLLQRKYEYATCRVVDSVRVCEGVLDVFGSRDYVVRDLLRG